VELLDAMLRHGLLEEKSFSRTGRGDTTDPRFDVTRGRSGNTGGVRTGYQRDPAYQASLRRACLDWTQRAHLNGALAAAITARLFELGWIERGRRRRSVRVTAAGAAGLAVTFGLDLPRE
jgi:hypothetical protein